MKSRSFHQLACPLDGAPLTLQERQLICPQGHSFDLARQGYANLLPVQHKKSRSPGDSKAMVAARGAFLDSGLYAPIAERLTATALTLLPEGQDLCVLDAGCGEGYYTDLLYRQLAARPGEGLLQLVGLDIAKPAIAAATRRNKAITWLVGSNARPPLLPASVDLVLCAFGFPSYEAFRQVLKPGGCILLVDPGPEHLIELRQVIYPEVRHTPLPSLQQALAQGFSLQDSQDLRYRTEPVVGERLDQLLMMTPHLYRASAEGKAAVAELAELALTVEVVLRTLVLAERD
jgi:23S rRNA (guanine745-N1)-methyltransferase